MFSEKIFIFLYFWFLFVAVLTLASLVLWIYKILIPSSRLKYIKKYLVLNEKMNWKYDKTEKDKKKQIKQLLHCFVYNVLRFDGVFMIRLIAINSGELIASQIVSELWTKFEEHERDQVDNKHRSGSSGLRALLCCCRGQGAENHSKV